MIAPEYNVYEPSDSDPGEGELRRQALKKRRARTGFWKHLAAYLGFNAILVAIWFSGGRGFVWPIFPIAGWGIGLATNAWDAYGREPLTEERIRGEMDRMRK